MPGLFMNDLRTNYEQPMATPHNEVVILTKREEERIAEWKRGEQNGIKNEEKGKKR